jgi:cysteinyl-tRNA synthetase
MKVATLAMLLANKVTRGFLVRPSSIALFPRTVLKSTTEEKGKAADDYDDWYADFDPSKFGSDDDRIPGPSVRSNDRPSPRSNDRPSPRSNDRPSAQSNHDYERDLGADNSNCDVDTINNLISERLQARKTGRFEEADAIREDLMNQHGVMIHDKTRTWRSGSSTSGSGQRWSGGGNEQRGNQRQGNQRQGKQRGGKAFGPHGHDYNKSSGAGDNISALSEPDINRLLAERLDCKLNRDFYGADSIQEELSSAGVSVHDGMKEWRADGQRFGDYNADSPRPGRERGSRNDRNRGYETSPKSLDTPDSETIQAMVDKRSLAKQERDFEEADSIRDELRASYNVLIDDKLRQWSVGGDFGAPMNDRGEPHGPYAKSETSETPEDHEDIQRQVDLRNQARLDRDFDTADAIREDLLGRNIVIEDRLRQWAVGGFYSDRSTTPASFQRRGGGAISEEDEGIVAELLFERDGYKKDREFEKADRIRDRLSEEFQVRVDDRSKEWHVVTNEYLMSPGSAPLDAATQKYVEEMIATRAIAKLNKDYGTADSIRDELMDDYLVSIDDRIKEWTALSGETTDSENQGKPELEGVMVENVVDELESDVSEINGGSVDEDDEEEINIVKLTVNELKNRLRAKGLKVSGLKAELIERLKNA